MNSSEKVQDFFLSKLSKDRADEMRQYFEAYEGSISQKKSRKSKRIILTAAVELANAGTITLPDLNDSDEEGNLEEALKPIIEKMLKEHYNH
jgi:flagellar motor switch protein FliG